ncbi:DNA-3-methyladenine glycosylase [Glutamicibacter sp. X7]
MDRSLFEADALEVAPKLLGGVLRVNSVEGVVGIRLTEVEAYHGVGTSGPYDAGSHSRNRRTERNAAMFGEPGCAYVYLSYGIHYALNLVCSPPGIASAVLLRAGEVIEGVELARARRTSGISDHQLARGPGNLGQALGITRAEHNGRDLGEDPFEWEPPASAPTHFARGPRVGVALEAGGPQFPWRFWLPGEPSVSAFRRGRDAPAWKFQPERDVVPWSFLQR